MRIVSLLPSATDAVVALGGGSMLVGISHSCDANLPGVAVVTTCEIDADASSASIDAAVREITTEGRALYRLDRARIEELSPDLIITQGLCEVCAVSEAEVHRVAASIGSRPRVISVSGGTIEGVLSDLATIGTAIGFPDEAEELTLGLRRRIRTVHETLKGAQVPRPRVVVLEWTDPLFSGGHWVPEQVKRAGGVDAIARPGEHSRVVTREAVETVDPNIVLIAPCGFGIERAAEEAAQLRESWPWLAARECWALDANSLTSRPGPRIVDGIETMARIFSPSIFTPVRAQSARRLQTQ